MDSAFSQTADRLRVCMESLMLLVLFQHSVILKRLKNGIAYGDDARCAPRWLSMTPGVLYFAKVWLGKSRTATLSRSPEKKERLIPGYHLVFNTHSWNNCGT